MPFDCPTCRNLCADEAVSCPKCGHPFRKPKQAKLPASNTEKLAGGVLTYFRVLFLITLIIVGFFAVLAVAAKLGYLK